MASSAGFQDFLNKHIVGPMGKFANFRFVRAVMAAGFTVISFTIVGSMFLILSNLQLIITANWFVDFYNNTLGRFQDLYSNIYNAVMGFIAIYFAGSFAFNFTKIYRDEEKIDVDPLNGMFLALFGFFITIPQYVWADGKASFLTSASKKAVESGSAVISGYGASASGFARLGATGIFTGLIIGTLAVQIYRLVVKKGWGIKMPDSVPKGVADSFTALLPGFIIAFVVGIIDGILVILGTDIFNVLYIPFSFVSKLVDSWWGVAIIFFLIALLWFVGIHGATIISSFYQAFTLSNLAANNAGGYHVFAGEFANAFVLLGGSGATLGVVLYMCFRAKSVQLRELGKLAIVPGLFNINEPILFGLPIVYNIDVAIPFALAPMTTAVVTYAAIASHLVPKITVQQPWPTPIGLGGFIATQSWRGAVLAVVTAIIAALIWYPFIKRYDNKLYKNEQAGSQAK